MSNKSPLDFAMQDLTEELHKPIIKITEKRKVYSSFINNIWGADLADMQIINKFNKHIFLSCLIDIFSKYAWMNPLKKKMVLQLLMLFKKS